MIQRTLILKTTDANGNLFQKAITNVNTQTTNVQIDEICRALAGLTTNTYQDTIRRDEESINEALAE